jgi:hypothetical protein
MKNIWAKILTRVIPPPNPAKPITQGFGHMYPWQLDTRWHDLQLTAQLAASYPEQQLRAELDLILKNYSPQEQFGQYHLGGWSGVALHAIDGDPTKDHDDFDVELHKTPALKHAPLMEQIIDSLPGEKRRVRILQLAPGKRVFWHSDAWHSIDSKLLRLHVPIIRNDRVGFQISHQDCPWKPGELWYGDFSFPHRLQNGGDASRIHLVIDLVNNDAIRELLPNQLLQQSKPRAYARQRSRKFVHAWDQLFATEKRLLEAQRARVAAG